MKPSIKMVIASGIGIKALVVGGVLLSSFLHISNAEASPIIRNNTQVYNSETGNGVRTRGAYNTQTGARYGKVGVYESSTGTYNRKSGAYNPTTSKGYQLNGEYVRGAGGSTQIDTLNNGSYSCNSSRSNGVSCNQ